jgi:hypothetical protein
MFMVKNLVILCILDPKPKGLCSTMPTPVPSKVGSYFNVNSDDIRSDGQDLAAQGKLRQYSHKPLDLRSVLHSAA